MMLPNLFSGLSDIEYKDTVLAHVPSHHQALYSVLRWAHFVSKAHRVTAEWCLDGYNPTNGAVVAN